MKILPLSETLAAQVDDVDLDRLDDSSFEEIYRAWIAHGVLRFREQALDDTQLEAFSSRFGAPG